MSDPCYQLIESIYQDRRAHRSQCFLMNHIDEGLVVLSGLQASLAAKQAFCLHPLVQMDEDLRHHEHLLEGLPSRAVALALEYRHIANGYLSQRTIESLEDIRLSPLIEVQQMLVADKIQNYKDFIGYHFTTHARSHELWIYFHRWFARLGLSVEEVKANLNLLTSIEESPVWPDMDWQLPEHRWNQGWDIQWRPQDI